MFQTKTPLHEVWRMKFSIGTAVMATAGKTGLQDSLVQKRTKAGAV